MFGYIRTDEPYLYKKDEVLYGAIYCGLCKSIGRLCGLSARAGLSYDLAFLSAMLHNLSDTDVKINKERCVAHWFKPRKIADEDEISSACAAFNTIMCYYKALDDLADTGKKNAKTALFKKGYKRAIKAYPELGNIAEDCYKELASHEKNKVSSVDIAADPFAKLAGRMSDLVLKGKATESTYNVFYFLGKWIYLIDAVDDLDKDIKSGDYNVFLCAYPDAKTGAELINEYKEDIFPILNSVFWHLKQSLSEVQFYFNKDLIENVLLRGIPKKTDEIIKKYLPDPAKE